MAGISVATSSGNTATVDDSALEEFALNLRGPLLRPGDEDYDDARLIFNAMNDRRPAMIVRCTGTADVIDAVNFARAHDLLVAVRGGGHGIAGNAMCDDGLVIDLSQMNGVRVDRKAATVHAQGGATWGDLDRETQAFGLAAAGGMVSTTGIAGLTLSGGIGWTRSKHGLSCDNLVSAEVVTAGGDVVAASEDENADLFWALRGGGGNFGVVTSFEFRLHSVGPLMMATVPIFPLSDAPGILRQWRDWVGGAPDEVTSTAVLWTAPVHPDLPEHVHNQPVIMLPAFYTGPADEGRSILAPILEFGSRLGEIVDALRYRAIQTMFDPVFATRGENIGYWKSLYVKEFDDEFIDAFSERALDKDRSPLTILDIHYLGGAIMRVGADETAFAPRDAPFMVSIVGNWHDAHENDMRVAWVREAWDRFQPYSTGAVYANFMSDQGPDSDAVARAAFGGNYDRLVDVKTKYDPTNLFRLNQNIVPR